jgi:transglutaminase-like putative cysteine protease
VPATASFEHRHVAASLHLEVAAVADVAVAIAVADGATRAREALRVELDGRPVPTTEVPAACGGRIHVLRDLPAGDVTVEYSATVSGPTSPPVVHEADWLAYIRPSRYCESDRLGPLARSEFAGLSGRELLDAVSSWVGAEIAYVPGSSRPIDGAVSTLLSRSGVCRDFAHLTVALLRANGIPARIVSVYAPGLEPMDFHAVAEALLDERWYVVDPTCLAPRTSLVRIATGADAADTAFLTTISGSVELADITVTATADPALPDDDLTGLAQLR